MAADRKQTEQSLQEEQNARESREARRAVERANSQHAGLIGKSRESKTSYGHALFQNYAELYSQGINSFLAAKLVNPYSAGRHHQVWEFLLHFCNQGPRPIAVIALTRVIDRISAVSEKKKLAAIIGRALQDELNGTVIHDTKGTVLMTLVRKQYGREAVSRRVMNQLKLSPAEWTLPEKRELGCLLLDILISSTHLIEEVQQGRQLLIRATPEVEELIRSKPPRAMSIRRLPSLIPLKPWTDVQRNGKPLVSSRRAMDLSHITKDSVAVQMEVVNGLEAQTMRVNPWMAQMQREAWDCNLPVFPVSREPTQREFGSEIASKRARIEESLQQAEQVAGRPIWLEHDMDFRGRIYCSSRIVGHQGPDHMKALVEFHHGAVTDENGFEQMLMAAAGHFGLGKSLWSERLAWGKQNLELLRAVGQQPLDRIDLWKGADDPWQFVQLAKAIDTWLGNPSAEMRVPIRFDQTCSGMGIIACLTRDRQLAQLTNCIGDRREDLYGQIALDLSDGLQRDLQGFDFASARMAELWLKHSITRELTKGPTMTTIYGARHFGIVEQLIDFLMEKNPNVGLDSWDREYTWPAQYLARKLNVVIGYRMKSCVAMEAWLRAVSKACMKRQRRIRFNAPMGFPIALGSQQEARAKISTRINGSKRWETPDIHVVSGELSARATNRGITANVIHAFDASFCCAVVHEMHRRGLSVITNHDCFAALPSNAGQLHRLLLDQLREQYKPDWLTDIREGVCADSGVKLPAIPFVGDLCEGEIGQNPYCFS